MENVEFDQGFVKLRTSQRGKEIPRHKMNIKRTYGGGSTLLSMLGKGNYFFFMSIVSVREKDFSDLWMVTIAKEDHSVFPYGLMVRIGGE